MELRIGCTGWGYQAWQGAFYPKKLEKTNWLKFYSEIFNATEVNSSFYTIPSQWITRKWNEDTPPNFRFTMKFPRVLTHENRLSLEKCHDSFHSFIVNLEPLKEKIAVLVFQLPPSIKFEEARPKLEDISKHLPHYCRYAVEGRDESWFSPESTKFLSDLNFCLVWSEVPYVDNPAPITTDFVYLRMIGDRAIPDDTFGSIVRDQTPVLEKWAKRLKNVMETNPEIKQAFVMSNNHLEGFSPETSNRFRQIMGLEKLEFVGKDQKTLFSE